MTRSRTRSRMSRCHHDERFAAARRRPLAAPRRVECAPTALNIYTSMGHTEPDAFLRVSLYAYGTGFVLITTVALV